MSLRFMPWSERGITSDSDISGRKLITFRIVDLDKRVMDQVDALKFICREYWTSLFGKPIDSLKTNKRGVYVLLDVEFGWISRFAEDVDAVPEATQLVILYLAFPCGLLRGALTGLGHSAAVTAEIPSFPQCCFQVRMVGASEDAPGEMTSPTMTISS